MSSSDAAERAYHVRHVTSGFSTPENEETHHKGFIEGYAAADKRDREVLPREGFVLVRVEANIAGRLAGISRMHRWEEFREFRAPILEELSRAFDAGLNAALEDMK